MRLLTYVLCPSPSSKPLGQEVRLGPVRAKLPQRAQTLTQKKQNQETETQKQVFAITDQNLDQAVPATATLR